MTPRQNNNGAALETGATQLKVVKQPFFKQVHLLSSSHLPTYLLDLVLLLRFFLPVPIQLLERRSSAFLPNGYIELINFESTQQRNIALSSLR